MSLISTAASLDERGDGQTTGWLHSKILIVPQAVHIPAQLSRWVVDTRTPSGGSAAPPLPYSMRTQLGLPAGSILLLLPLGLRPVKDPTFLLSAVQQWHIRDPRVHMVLVGPDLDPKCAAEVYSALGMPLVCTQHSVKPPDITVNISVLHNTGVTHIPPISHFDLLCAIAESDVLCNSSLNEGMCNSILEAMAVGTPVVARENIGNASLVCHGENGFLFDTPATFEKCCMDVVESSERKAAIRRGGLQTVEKNHSEAAEIAAYMSLVTSLQTENHQ